MDECKYREKGRKRQKDMDEKKNISCICILGTVPPVSASETSAEGIECTDEEKSTEVGLVVLRGINNMKKALIVTTISGFVPQFEMNNVFTLQKMGYEVHYASNFHNPHYGSDNHRLDGTGIICHQIDFVRSPFHVAANLKAYRQLYILLQEQMFDFIHCHTPMGGVLGRLAAEQNRRKQHVTCRVIYTAHGFHFFRGAPFINWIFYYPVERWLAHFTDILITINREDYQRAKRFHLRRLEGKVEKVNGVGIDVTYYQKITIDREAVRKEIGVKKGQLFFLSIGELNRNKNHRIMIEALAKIKKDICYVICGEGKSKKNLEKLIKKYQLENKVQLLGYRRDIPELLKAADLFVLPSFREGLSLSLQEAMACGVPVIASDIRGNRELIDRGKGGWLLSPKDKKGLIRVIQTIEKKNLTYMGQYNGRKIKAYDKRIMTGEMKKIYDSIDKEIL